MPAPYPLIRMISCFAYTQVFWLNCASRIASWRFLQSFWLPCNVSFKFLVDSKTSWLGLSNMAAAHNHFVQGINAIIAHAPHITEEKVQPFMTFCLSLVRPSPCCLAECSYSPLTVWGHPPPPSCWRNILLRRFGKEARQGCNGGECRGTRSFRS